jgi:hypothetical protein
VAGSSVVHGAAGAGGAGAGTARWGSRTARASIGVRSLGLDNGVGDTTGKSLSNGLDLSRDLGDDELGERVGVALLVVELLLDLAALAASDDLLLDGNEIAHGGLNGALEAAEDGLDAESIGQGERSSRRKSALCLLGGRSNTIGSRGELSGITTAVALDGAVKSLNGGLDLLGLLRDVLGRLGGVGNGIAGNGEENGGVELHFGFWDVETKRKWLFLTVEQLDEMELLAVDVEEVEADGEEYRVKYEREI